MKIRPIRTDGEYESAISRIELLIDAQPKSEQADELEVLSTLVEQYELKNFSIEAPTPLAAIRFRMEQQNLSPKDLEPYIGSRSRVSEILSGTRALSIDMIRALNQHLGIPAESLIAQEPAGEDSAAKLSKAATKLLVGLKVMTATEGLDKFFARALGGAAAVAMLRKTRTTRTNAKTDTLALQAWCAAAIVKSSAFNARTKFNKSNLDLAYMRDLAQLSARREGPRLVEDKLESIGIAFVILPHLPDTFLDGAAICRPDGVPIVAMTLRRDRIDNFWFTLMHELAHVKCHLDTDRTIIIDDLEIASADQIEEEADLIAADALIPRNAWSNFNSGSYCSLADVNELAAAAGVHPAIVAGRWQQHNREFRKFAKLLGHGSVRVQFADSLS